MSPGLNRTNFEHLVQEVGEHLPGLWELNRNPADWNWGAKLTDHETCAILHLNARGNYRSEGVTSMTVRGEVPKNARGESPYIGYGKSMTEINVAVSKSPGQIAKEIERRFMPAYMEILKGALDSIASSDTYHDKVNSVAKRIADLAGVPYETKNDGRVLFHHSSHEILTDSNAKVYDNDVTLELSLSHENALDVLRFLIRK